jgi:hypothetical protein
MERVSTGSVEANYAINGEDRREKHGLVMMGPDQ